MFSLSLYVKNTMETFSKKNNTLERENNSSVCMYFHDPSFYSEEKVRTGIDELKRLTDKIEIKTIYVLLNSNQDLIKIEL